MPSAHALNLSDSLDTMSAMETKKKGPEAPPTDLPARHTARQTPAIARLQICRCHQQQFQQQQ